MGGWGNREWLEADGAGGFAMGTASGVRTRRYHGLLTVATTPPTGRVSLVGAVEAWLETQEARLPLSTHRYAPDVIHPRGVDLLESFLVDPWPTWRFRLPDGHVVVHEVLVDGVGGDSVLRWHLPPLPGARLSVRPLLSGRDYHALHRENPAFRFDPTVVGGNASWRPYPDLPAITALSDGEYHHAPEWFRSFLYAEERARGLDHVEDLASPGAFTWELAVGDGGAGSLTANLVLRPGDGLYVGATRYAESAVARERTRRGSLGGPLGRSADAYFVQRGAQRTLIAGYPWFTDWGRDTFIAMRGLCLASGREDEAARVLLGWADEVTEGMLPNRFTDGGEAPELNAVDASLWFVVAVSELVTADTGRGSLTPGRRATLERAALDVVRGYAEGTRYGIRADHDGLVAAGEPGLQLTWMDAKAGDWVVTPRIGKPVEVQALWITALAFAARLEPRWASLHRRALGSFDARFWDEDRGYLADVVDVDHRPGELDVSFRPNQILAVGGLPTTAVQGPRARRIVDAVEARLWTPLGLRSLPPDDPRYRGTYEGGVVERDGAYHQGTVWPWLLGPFVDAWLGVRGRTPEARLEARRRFLRPLEAHLGEAGLGHVSEIADGDAPHRPRGAPFQAWSLGELMRIRRWVGADEQE